MDNIEPDLENLIGAIKQRAIAAANEERKRIQTEIKLKADGLIKDAMHRASVIEENAKQKAEQFQIVAHATMLQASRDIILKVREQIEQMLNQLLSDDIEDLLSTDNMVDLITKVALHVGDLSNITIQVDPLTSRNLIDRLRIKMKEQMLQGLSIDVSNHVGRGFGISTRNGEIYYDVSIDSIKQALFTLLRPSLRKLLKDA